MSALLVTIALLYFSWPVGLPVLVLMAGLAVVLGSMGDDRKG